MSWSHNTEAKPQLFLVKVILEILPHEDAEIAKTQRNITEKLEGSCYPCVTYCNVMHNYSRLKGFMEDFNTTASAIIYSRIDFAKNFV